MSNRRRLRPGPYRLLTESAATAVAPGETRTIGTVESDTAGAAAETNPTPVALSEATAAAVIATPTGATQLLQLITPGWGSSGYYSEAVLQAAARQSVFHEGLQLYIDHPTPEEEAGRPERSVRDLAAVLTEDARWDPGRKALVATAEVFPDHREALVAKHRHIGLSIRANGTAEYGEAEGRRGPIVTAITEAWSVDYVTRAGRGGKVLALLESAPGVRLREAATLGARIEAKVHSDWTLYADSLYAEGRITRQERITLSSAVGDALAAFTARVERDAPGVYARDLYDDPAPPAAGYVVEAATQDISRALSAALHATYGGDDMHVWVRDFDPDRQVVWFDVNSRDECSTYEQPYTRDGAVITLTGTRVEGVMRQVFTPLAPPADAAATRVVETATSTAPPPGAGSSVTDGAPPAAPNQPEKEVPDMSGTTTGPAPGTAGTATAAGTPTAGLSPEAQLQIAQAQLAEAQARITALTAERDTAIAERDTALAETRRMRNVESARGVCATVLDGQPDLPAATRARIVEAVTREVPTTDAGDVDTARLTEAVTRQVETERAYIASIREAAGEGTPTGLGDTTPTSGAGADVAGFQESVASRFQRWGLDEKTARAAATGRGY